VTQGLVEHDAVGSVVDRRIRGLQLAIEPKHGFKIGWASVPDHERGLAYMPLGAKLPACR
jgi:hypothetical protein